MKSLLEKPVFLNSIGRKFFTIPADLDLDKMMALHPPQFKKRSGKFNKWSAIIILHELCKDYNTGNICGNSLNAKEIRKKVHNYLDYIRWLQSSGVIVDTMNHRAGYYSKSYYINPDYLGSGKKYIMANEIEILDRLKIMAEKKLPDSYIENHLYLFKAYQYPEKLSVDEMVLESIILNQCVDEYGVYDGVKAEKYYRQTKAFKTVDYHRNNFSIDDFGNRFYSPICIMDKVLRNCLRYNNESLMALDIKSSLPYLLNILLKQVPVQVTDYKKKGIKNFPIMVGNFKSLKNNELQDYLRMTSDGTIYRYLRDYLVEKMGLYYYDYIHGYDERTKKALPMSYIYPLSEFNSEKEREHKICKTLFSHYLSCKNRQSRIEGFFIEKFPSIHDFIYLSKEGGGMAYKKLPKALQKLESTIVIDIICKEYMEENPEAIVFPIHDNIATQSKYIDILRRKSEEVFLRYLSVPPAFNIEYWCQGCQTGLEAA